MCVQRLDDSLNSAIHITYRSSLRSSSMPEPRDPLLKVLTVSLLRAQTALLSGMKVGVVPGGLRAPLPGKGRFWARSPPKQQGSVVTGGRLGAPEGNPHSVMILPQVHLRKPCYDFYFL